MVGTIWLICCRSVWVSKREASRRPVQARRYAEEYRKAGIIELENGPISCCGETQLANVPGEMAGRRWVHGFDAATLRPGGWHETVDNAGNVRQVRPQLNNGRAAMNGSFPRPSAPKQTISFRPTSVASERVTLR